MSRTKRTIPPYLKWFKHENPDSEYAAELLKIHQTDKTPGSPVYTSNGIDVDTPISKKFQKRLKAKRERRNGKKIDL